MSERLLSNDEHFMRLALREAELASAHGDVPIGAVVERGGELIAATHNERELRQDPTAHAEVLALREAARGLDSWRVLDNGAQGVVVPMVNSRQEAWRRVIATAVANGIPVPAFGVSLAYFDSYRRPRLPANLIQAQRDFFGAHTYERIDKPGVFHTEWASGK